VFLRVEVRHLLAVIALPKFDQLSRKPSIRKALHRLANPACKPPDVLSPVRKSQMWRQYHDVGDLRFRKEIGKLAPPEFDVGGRDEQYCCLPEGSMIRVNSSL